jgi:hypothetical protein
VADFTIGSPMLAHRAVGPNPTRSAITPRRADRNKCPIESYVTAQFNQFSRVFLVFLGDPYADWLPSGWFVLKLHARALKGAPEGIQIVSDWPSGLILKILHGTYADAGALGEVLLGPAKPCPGGSALFG